MAVKSTIRTAALMSALTLTVAGCVQIRLLTYPAEFKWIDDTDVQSVMQSMAIRMRRVDELLVNNKTDNATSSDANPSEDSASLHQQVLAEVTGMEQLAATLQTGGRNTMAGEELPPTTNHLLLDEHLNEFIAQLNHARWQLEAEPPSYYGAGQLVGNCNACHRMR